MRHTLIPVVVLLLVTSSVCIHGHAAEDSESAGEANIHFRGSMTNCRIQFAQHGKGHVAFMGGSITEMEGYRPMVCEILRRRFPQTRFTFTDAGISSTCSTTGACRLQTDVLDKGPVDLFFIEFAVNDDQDAAHARRECVRGMEGVVRHLRRHNPCADMVITYFANPGMVESYTAGQTPLSIASHAEVARHYRISTINLAKEVTRQIAAGSLTWEKFGGTHPAPHGNAICADMIDRLLTQAWAEPLPADAQKTPHTLPASFLDEKSYARGRFVAPAQAEIDGSWRIHVPDWKSLAGSCRRRFQATPLLCAEQPGAELKLKFSGTAVGAYVLAGPDAGTVETSVDDGPPRMTDLYHRFSRGLHYPRTVMFAADLEPGEHTLRLRIGDAKNANSRGHAVRILQFTAN